MASAFLTTFLAASLLAQVVSQATIDYEWNVTSFYDNPDGYGRLVLGINNQPGYSTAIQGNLGDLLRVKVINQIQNATSIHWHGMLQNGTSNMDGAIGVTQCEIPPGGSYQFEFPLTTLGTHWWHSHFKDQYLDGLRGPLIIRNPNDPNKDLYDEEMVVLLEDWYHSASSSLSNLTTSPQWSAGLINGRGQYTCTTAEKNDPVIQCKTQPPSQFTFSSGKRYRLRIINASGYAAFNFSIAGHAMKVIEADGVDLTPSRFVTNLFLNVAQRYSVVVAADQVPATYYMYGTLSVNTVAAQSAQVTPNSKNIVYAYVVYDNTPYSGTTIGYPTVYYNETLAIPLVNAVPQLSTRIVTFAFKITTNGSTKTQSALISANGGPWLSYKTPDIPTLFDVTYNGKDATSLPSTSLAVNIWNKDIVDLIVMNNDRGEHPFHLHGHHFWVIASGNAASVSLIPTSSYNLNNPSRRDTVTVLACSSGSGGTCSNPGYVVLRFVADNPGVWFLHCHIDWHMMMGMAMTIVESPDILSQQHAYNATGCPQSVTQGLTGYSST